jgi:UDP-N-acetylmuramoyl-L-alanyl-D-glutamate--2,6-diaminopimelate ligase
MKLSVLAKHMPQNLLRGVVMPGTEKDPDITSVGYRSDQIKKGGLFVAVKGFKKDGHEFIDHALSNGAAAVVSELPVSGKIPTLEVDNSRKALAFIADKFFNSPSKELTIIAVTGTNGKTTTAFLVQNILTKAGFDTGVISTVDYRFGGKIFNNPMTTPESLDLQKILAQMLSSGVTHVVLEVSSHAVDLHRIAGCRIDMGIFTNLSQDHLDFHGDMETYWRAKRKLFTEHLFTDQEKDQERKAATAVINCNDPKGQELLHLLESVSEGSQLFSIGSRNGYTVRHQNTQFDLKGVEGTISTPLGDINFTSGLAGKYNLENILCAVGAGIAIEVSLDAIKTGIESFPGVPGRMERIENTSGKFVFVDYAHTPDALGNVLNTLKSITRGKLICIFGCGGDRDRTKRPEMGKIAVHTADFTVITSDNPRTEDPMSIISDILTGIEGKSVNEYQKEECTKGFIKKGYTIDPNRRSAIKFGIEIAESGDTVLIAGKGHETYQILATETIHFDDREEAKKVLEGNDE